MSKIQLWAIYSASPDTHERAKSIYETYLKSYLPNFIHVVFVIADTITYTESDAEQPDASYVRRTEEDSSTYFFQDARTLFVHSKKPEIELFRALAIQFPDAGGCLKCDDTILPNLSQIRGLLEYMGNGGIDCIGKTTEPSYHDPMYYLSMKVMTLFQDQDQDLTMILTKNNIQISSYETLYCDDISNIHRCSVHQSSPKPTIFVGVDSGLGNQMFKIASAYGIARKNNRNMVAIAYDCHCTHTNNPYAYYSTIFRGIPHIRDNRVMVTNLYQEPQRDCWVYNPNILVENQEEDIRLGGYFQNDRYFREYKDEISKMFLRQEMLNDLSSRFPDAKNSYFIHIRRGDYLMNQNYWIDMDKYYSTAIQYILTKNPYAHFYVFSNDLPFCKQWHVLKYSSEESIQLMWDPAPKKPPLNITFVENLGDVESLYLMVLCRLGGICANSTFSWWGGYLNDNPEKIITIPKRWFNDSTYPFQEIFYEGVITFES
jgi:hypothetical protein